MNDRGVLQLGPLSTTDLRASLVHEYKPFISDLRNSDRLDYGNGNKNNGIDVRSDVGSNNNNNAPNDVDINRHNEQQQQQDQKPYSSPSTPPTPHSADGQMNDTKVCKAQMEFFFLHLFFFILLVIWFVDVA